MKKVTVNLYNFSELGPEQQKRALENIGKDLNELPPPASPEWLESLAAFTKHKPPLVLKTWDTEAGTIYTEVEGGDKSILSLWGRSAWEWLKDNGWFTIDDDLAERPGDYHILEPLKEFMEYPSIKTLDEIFTECYQCWFENYRHELNRFYSEEHIREIADFHYYLETGEFANVVWDCASEITEVRREH